MTKKIRFIGDIHGDYLSYIIDIEGIENTIQVGDFGFGFGLRGKADYIDSLISSDPGNHRFIRGNHDDPDECAKSAYFIPDGHLEDNMMFVGGALSIDRAFRTEGVSWWEGEELSISRLSDMISLYEKHKPEIMVTHDCPEFIAKQIMIPLVRGSSSFPSRTRDAFDAMYKIHKPKLHIFGHWHFATDVIIDGTRFICLPELGYIDIDIENI